MNRIIKFIVFVWIVILFAIFFLFVPINIDKETSKNTNISFPEPTSITESISETTYIASIPEPSPISTPTLFYPLTDYERWLVESIMAGESGIEPYWGKVAVASCILNACLLEDKRPEEIQTMYGYAGWKPIEEFESECMAAYGNTKFADEIRDAVSQVFDNGEILNNEILWFCSGYSQWHESQKFVIEIGGHRFFAPWN